MLRVRLGLDGGWGEVWYTENMDMDEGLLKKPDDEKWKEIDLTEEIKSCEKVMAQLKQYGHEKLVWAGQGWERKGYTTFV
eukprot:1393088-Amorphochlora_amoeboformis.AAC.1